MGLRSKACKAKAQSDGRYQAGVTKMLHLTKILALVLILVLILKINEVIMIIPTILAQTVTSCRKNYYKQIVVALFILIQ